ncbi:MAG: ABC transporter ATP-binding protein [Bacilli bacterium]
MFRLLKYTKGYIKYSILAPLLVIIETTIEVYIPILMSDMLDYGISAGDTDYVLQKGFLMIALCVVSFFGGVFSAYFATKASAGFGKNLRKELYQKVQEFSFSNIDKFSTSGLITRMTTDVTNVRMSFQMTIRICFRAPIIFIGALIFAYYKSPELANVFAIGAPILVLLIVIIIIPVNKLYKKVLKSYDNLNLVTQENINGIKTVKAYTTEKKEIKKFYRASDLVKRLFLKAESINATIAPAAYSVMYVCTLVVSYLGARLVVSNTIGTGTLTALIAYGTQILFAIIMIANIAMMLIMSKASSDRINEVLLEVPSITDPENPITEIPDGSIEFNHVNFSYKKGSSNKVLRDINFKINSGETVGIFGPTGSSKTTLVSLIGRLYDVEDGEGEVKVGGHNVKEYSLSSLREEVAVVLQKNKLFSGTIRSNLQWGNPNATDEEMLQACDYAQAREIVEGKADGLDSKVEEEGNNFSGGQKQRLCIARALLKNPKILILDDSTSAVDTKTDAKIKDAFINRIPNTTKIIISQRISSIQKADKIIILENGRISAMGTHDELITSSDLYRSIYKAQAQSRPDMQEVIENA